MSNIKVIIVKYLRLNAAIMAMLIIALAAVIQVIREQQLTRIATQNMFMQIERMLSQNSQELDEVKEEYGNACLNNAKTIAYIIENVPSALESVDELKNIAEFTDVDEIHLFNTEGVIYNGTHPEYYNMSVNDGEQIGFFKQMLSDKSLKLVQPITPNTAIGELIQYSAVWSPNGEFFVQVGMKQENVLKVTKKNELSYIFSLIKVNSSVDLYAVDKESSRIVGATASENTGKKLADIGIDPDTAKSAAKGFHTRVNGKLSFCIFTDCGTNYVGRVIPFEEMYRNVTTVTLILAIGIIVMVFLLVIAVTRFLNREIISEIKSINESLVEISEGNLDARVNVCTCVEFSELSSHINDMIASVLSSTDKISYVLNKADLQIGVYEYNEKMKTVRFTEKIPKIFDCDSEEIVRLSKDCTIFKEYLAARIFDNVNSDENIYRIYGNEEKYIKFEEFSSNNSILGIVMDITKEYNRHRQLEVERDIDALTGLFNRSGMDRRLEALFRHPDKLGNGALVMVDADGLKKINDQYGHEAGDIYLKSIGEILREFDSRNSICARYGGDEFVLFLYNFESRAAVDGQLQKLAELRESSTAPICEGVRVPVNFSFGVGMLDGSRDFYSLLKYADEKMYESKRERKMARM